MIGTRRNFRSLLAGIALVGAAGPLASCSATPGGKPVSELSPEAARVAAALQRMPQPSRGEGITRTFFATFHAAGQRTTASGVLQYYGPRDFRITAATELGVLLFDGRVDWAGVHVIRHMSGLDEGIVATLITDLSRAFDMPDDLEGLAASNDKMLLKRKRGDGHTTTWTFDRSTGRLMRTDIDMGFLDTLHIEYRAYAAQGWPSDLYVQRRARLYDISLTFTKSQS
ncbi:MAG TPA: hypothetical protein VFV87_17120 [Pirellulaceae bacterium]|nr:hypothetical protein [Pirellulaceae bacterium]